MAIERATDATFDALVLRRPRPVLVYFWAAWASPCALLAPEIEMLAARYHGAIDVVTVDVDANPRVSAAYAIQSVPTIAFFQPDRPPTGIIGFRSAAEIEIELGLARFRLSADAAPAPVSSVDLAEIARLGELRDRGVLTDDEFTALKTKLLAPR